MDIATAQICVFGTILVVLGAVGSFMKARQKDGTADRPSHERDSLL